MLEGIGETSSRTADARTISTTCFQEQDPDRKLFDTWSASLKSFRWQCVTEFTSGLLKGEFQLRSKWSKRAYLSGSGSFRPRNFDQNTDYGAAIASTDSTICSKYVLVWRGSGARHQLPSRICWQLGGGLPVLQRGIGPDPGSCSTSNELGHSKA